MNELKSIEIAELAQITVNGKVGANIFNAARECIALANLLKCSVKLYWNGRWIYVYVNSSLESIINNLRPDTPVTQPNK